MHPFARLAPLSIVVVAACARSNATPNPSPAPSANSSASASVASSADTTPTKYLFVDGGAHLGETVNGFVHSKIFPLHPWSIVSFEPNPELAPQIPKRPDLTVRQEAIWTKDCDLEFQFSERETLGGSVVDTVVQLPEMKKVTVHAVDFSAWLKNAARKEDVVFVKLDIEGAEYPVLERMLKDGSMRLVDCLYLEFHGVQQAEAKKASHDEIVRTRKHDDELVEAITSLGIAVSLHENEEAQGTYFDFDPEKYGQTW